MQRLVLACALSAVLMGTASADQLLIDKVHQEQQTASQRPKRGETMKTVRARQGQPRHIDPAVGDPPITRWEYPAFTVYFEKNRVIHTVMRQ
ncbi:MAG TPA: hypothetical protein VKA32_07560 [Gammaproteobacteria bacterium]|nr:hypothetical protein [Gammaproteobacteria bacterium]